MQLVWSVVASLITAKVYLLGSTSDRPHLFCPAISNAHHISSSYRSMLSRGLTLWSGTHFRPTNGWMPGSRPSSGIDPRLPSSQGYCTLLNPITYTCHEQIPYMWVAQIGLLTKVVTEIFVRVVWVLDPIILWTVDTAGNRRRFCRRVGSGESSVFWAGCHLAYKVKNNRAVFA